MLLCLWTDLFNFGPSTVLHTKTCFTVYWCLFYVLRDDLEYFFICLYRREVVQEVLLKCVCHYPLQAMKFDPTTLIRPNVCGPLVAVLTGFPCTRKQTNILVNWNRFASNITRSKSQQNKYKV